MEGVGKWDCLKIFQSTTAQKFFKKIRLKIFVPGPATVFPALPSARPVWRDETKHRQIATQYREISVIFGGSKSGKPEVLP